VLDGTAVPQGLFPALLEVSRKKRDSHVVPSALLRDHRGQKPDLIWTAKTSQFTFVDLHVGGGGQAGFGGLGPFRHLPDEIDGGLVNLSLDLDDLPLGGLRQVMKSDSEST